MFLANCKFRQGNNRPVFRIIHIVFGCPAFSFGVCNVQISPGECISWLLRWCPKHLGRWFFKEVFIYILLNWFCLALMAWFSWLCLWLCSRIGAWFCGSALVAWLLWLGSRGSGFAARFLWLGSRGFAFVAQFFMVWLLWLGSHGLALVAQVFCGSVFCGSTPVVWLLRLGFLWLLVARLPRFGLALVVAYSIVAFRWSVAGQ